jgi:RNA polymerase sigma factor (sigma-70 family)
MAIKESWQLNQAEFDSFLAWLHAEREQAAQQYENIRRSLIAMFRSRGLAEAEDLADETINRVIKRVVKTAEPVIVDRAGYFHTVAHNLILQRAKRKPVAVALDETQPQTAHGQTTRAAAEAEEKERVHACLERCLARFPPAQREMVLSYYQQDKQARIEQRKALAERLGLELSVLRLRVFRARGELASCLEKCLQGRPCA